MAAVGGHQAKVCQLVEIGIPSLHRLQAYPEQDKKSETG